MKSIDLVRQFHVAFGQPIRDTPSIDNEAINALRVALILEETRELDDALEARDPVAVLDALTDLQYVLDGAYLSLGFHRFKDAASAEVHRSNMSKLDDGAPVLREDGKILKGPDYSPPNLGKILNGDPWIEWGGGECPVEKGAMGFIKLKNGTENQHAGDISDCRWIHDLGEANIIAYRLA